MIFDSTPLIRSNSYGPLVAILAGFYFTWYCMAIDPHWGEVGCSLEFCAAKSSRPYRGLQVLRPGAGK